MTSGIGAGLSAQLGIKTETTYGTAVVVDKFPEFLSEGIKNNITRLQAKGIQAGRRTARRFKAGAQMISGPINMELTNKPMATLCRHMFGGAAGDSGSGPYVHAYAPGALAALSFTAQIGRPSVDGTINPFTYAGCKIPSWTISAQADQIALCSLDVVAQSETTATALATYSALSGIQSFVFSEGVITVNGSAVTTINSVTLKGDNGLKTDRKRLGAATISEPLENALRTYTCDVVADFESLTHYARVTGATETAVVLTFTAGADILAITLNCRTDGDTPVVDGEGLLSQPLKFVAESTTGDSSAISVSLTNGETVST